MQVSVWGEEYIEVGIPAEEFEDGWSVKYDDFLIVLGDVSLEKQAGAERGSLAAVVLFDLTEAGPQTFGTLDGLPEGHWEEFGFSNLVASDATERGNGVSAEKWELMVGEGYSVYVTGTASKDDEHKHFAWGFSKPVRYAGCVDVGAGQRTPGLMLGDGADAEAQLTIHGDHLFYDDLVSPEAKLRFAVIAAADADDDGEVTLEELAARELAELSAAEGAYGVGAFDVDDMRGFVEAAALSLGHFNGEGHCRPERP
ncbi:MAG TPA: hypothetical protein VFU02_12765 [Polyangiaceae bacterium]|nr:hypothetical protein [Polyangiaceae bacterium]